MGKKSEGKAADLAGRIKPLRVAPSGAVVISEQLPEPGLPAEVQRLRPGIEPLIEVESEEDDPPADFGLLEIGLGGHGTYQSAGQLLAARRKEGGGIERALRVVRVGPNPRMVICEYFELAERRRCVVNVGSNRKWVKGMRLRMTEPVSDEEYLKPWVYRGKGPRRRGWPKEV